MWHLTKTALRYWTEKLLHIHDSPERTAAAFAMGVAIGFSPFLGAHTVIGLVLAFAFNLNRVAVLVGLYLHLPWFMPFYYAGATEVGALILGTHPPSGLPHQVDVALHLPTWHARIHGLLTLVRALLLPFVVGSTLLGLILGAIAYPISLGFIRARKRLMLHHQQHARD